MRGLDGGYLGWIYGSAVQRMPVWSNVFLMYRRDYLVLDGHELWRKQLLRSYKSRREEKRARDPELVAKSAQVRMFQEEILKESFSPERQIHLESYEADDLLALMFLQGDIDSIVGIDKDYLQLPGIRLEETGTDEAYEFTEYKSRKIPLAIQPIDTPSCLLLCLTLLGDKSDSIPRILPLRRFDIYWNIRLAECPFRVGLKMYGRRFLQNLLLILLPPPVLLLDYEVHPRELVRLIDTGEYWNPQLFMTLEGVINEKQTGTGIDRLGRAIRFWQNHISSASSFT